MSFRRRANHGRSVSAMCCRERVRMTVSFGCHITIFWRTFRPSDACKSPKGWESMNLEMTLHREQPPRRSSFVHGMTLDVGVTFSSCSTRNEDDRTACGTRICPCSYGREPLERRNGRQTVAFLARASERVVKVRSCSIPALNTHFESYPSREATMCPWLALCAAKQIRARPVDFKTIAGLNVSQNVHVAIHDGSSLTGGCPMRCRHVALCGGFATDATSSGLSFVFIRPPTRGRLHFTLI